MIIFETERLSVCPYNMDDLDDFFSMNGDAEVMRYIRPVQSYEQSKEFLQKIIATYEERPGIGRWKMLLKAGQAFIGSFAIIPVEHSEILQLGYSLQKTNWGNGYASESVTGGIKYAFEKLRLPEIAGITFTENTPSQRVLLKNGFSFEKTMLENNNELSFYILRNNAGGQ